MDHVPLKNTRIAKHYCSRKDYGIVGDPFLGSADHAHRIHSNMFVRIGEHPQTSARTLDTCFAVRRPIPGIDLY